VLAFDLVTADGRLKTLSMDDTPNFKHHIINFGGLGVITSMTMVLVPHFHVSKSIYENLKWDTLFNKANLGDIVQSYDFLSIFTVWKDKNMTSVWAAKKYHRGDAIPAKESTFYGAKHTTERIHVIPG